MQRNIKLNKNVNLSVRSNAVMSPVSIKNGILEIGENGVEFNTLLGSGFIQIPYKNIEYISAEISMKIFYRGIIIKTTEGQTFEFIISKGKKVINELAKHLQKEQIRYRVSAWKRVTKK